MKLRSVYTFRLCHHLHYRQRYIAPVVTDRLMHRIDLKPILAIKWSVTIGTMMDFDGGGDGEGTVYVVNEAHASIKAHPFLQLIY